MIFINEVYCPFYYRFCQFQFRKIVQIIRRKAFARAGLIGNPSDGYHGKTISVIVKNFWTQATLYEWDKIEIVPSPNDESSFASLDDFAKDVRLHGYYGGIRLVKAAMYGFTEYCRQKNFALHDRNFSIRYETNIPRQVGMAGSSAIVVATFRVLMDFYGIEIPQHILPSLILSVEQQQLGIPAGLQDRVIQVYEGCVFMDFAPDKMETADGFECGHYEQIPTKSLPPLYLAYSADCGEPTEVFHNNLRFRYNQGEPAVVAAMSEFADLTVQTKKLLLEQGANASRSLAELINRNFDLRCSICQLPVEQIQMVETARRCACSAKFAGSGGAIIGTYPDEAAFLTLQKTMKDIGCETIKPLVGLCRAT
jgi:glucuronokinase